MNEIMKLNTFSFLKKIEGNAENDEWIKQQEEEEKRQNEKELALRRQKKFESSGVPPRYWNVDFSTYIPKNQENAANLEKVKSFANLENNDKVLLLLGPKGLGKTHLGSSIIRQCGGSYISIEDLIFKFDAAQDFHSKVNREDLLEQFSRTPMLVIDEIGRSMQQDKENYLLSYILRHRYENMLPTVLISNLSKNELLKKLGEATVDRLKETAVTLEFTGESYRQTKRDVNL